MPERDENGKKTGRMKRGNMPLFVYKVRLSLKLVTNTKGTFAVPVFSEGAVELEQLSTQAILTARSAAKYYKETILPAEREKIALLEADDGDSSPNSPSDDKNEFSDGGAELLDVAEVVPAEELDF